MPTGTLTTNATHSDNNVTRVEFVWTTDSSGAVSQPVATLSGTITNVEFVPGTSGSQPTNAYDVTITTAGGFDVLRGLGTDLSNTTTTRECPVTATNALPIVLAGDALTFTVAGGGNAKSGKVIVYTR